jgi:hypothetical protein
MKDSCVKENLFRIMNYLVCVELVDVLWPILRSVLYTIEFLF